MGALKLTACMKVVSKMGEMDQDALLDRLDRYTADGVPKEKAQVMAASDTLAELMDERRQFMAMLRQQHPDLFRIDPNEKSPIDDDEEPDSIIKRSRARSPSEIFGREIAPLAIKAYKSLSALDRGIIDGWNVNWHRGQGKFRNSEEWAKIIKAYEPVRAKLREVYGDTVPAYRGEQRDNGEVESDRFLFSWTPMREIAAGFALNRLRGMPAEIRQSKVDEQIENYRKTGIARMNGLKYVRKDPGDFKPYGPDYYYIYQGSEMITDGDNIAEALQSEKDERDEWISTLRDSGKLYTANIPVDSIAFIPVGANLRQPEFVAEYNPREDAADEIKLSTRRNDMGFYSALAKGIEDMQTKAAPAGAWKTQIKGLINKGAIKQDEVTWSGLEDWLDMQDGKVTKEAISEYLKQGGVQVNEVTLGKAESGLSLDDWLDDWSKNNEGQTANAIYNGQSWNAILKLAEEEGHQDVVNRVGAKIRRPEAKYGSYTLPGGENYREVLLTLPPIGGVKYTEENVIAIDDADDPKRSQYFWRFKVPGNELQISKQVYRTQEEAKAYILNEKQPEPPADRNYQSSHWDQKNVLAHIRVNDRTDADGGKVLFVEELQSDWGQDGKKNGFQAGTNGWNATKDEAGRWDVSDASGKYVATVDAGSEAAAISMIAAQQKGVPLAPFVTKTEGWLNLALKRVIAMAVDGGYDKVAFVSGEQSADRYDLSKQIQSISFKPEDGKGRGYLEAWDENRRQVVGKTVKTEELPDHIGKEVADRLLSTEKVMGKHLLDGEQLKVGGEGMKVFYDRLVPNTVKALLKKVGGGQLEQVEIDDRVPDSKAWMNALKDEDILKQPGFTITDAMRKKVSNEGLTLFSRKRNPQEDTPEFKAWFKNSKVVDSDGKPLVVYRGEHGSKDGQPRTVIGSYTFTDDAGVASTYAESPNDRRNFSYAESPAVIPAYLSIQNPIIDNRDDPFVEFGDLSEKLGLKQAERFARKHSRFIESTGNWDENYAEQYKSVDDLLDAEPGALGDLYMDAYPLLDDLAFVAAAEEAGFDGAIHAGNGESADAIEFRVFRPEQIKSATGNRGTFDGSNADITKSRGRTASGADWDSPSASKFDDLVYKLQDKQIDLKRVVESIKDAAGSIADDLNVYLQEELYHGRAAKRTEDFVNFELDPLLEQMKNDGLKLEDLEEYLHARHAEEANKVIAQRNPGEPSLQDGGSGMLTADAQQYLATLPADLKQKLDAAAAKVDAIIAKTRDLYVDYELESKDTVDAWGKMFQHYIPLQREDKDGSPGIGQGFSIKGKEVKGRTGSTRKVVDILANVALQREKAITRGEKNRVSQALVGLAESNPNDGFWQVDIVPTERVFNPKTGLVEDRVDPLYKSRENAVIAKIKDASGKVREHAVLFNEEDERAMRMAAALKNLDAANLEGLLGVSAKISRYFAAVNTQYNPVFGVVNLVRDVQGALLNIGSTPLAADRAKIAKYTASALRGIYSDMRASRKGQNPNSQWAALWDEFQEVGGQTGYRDLFKSSADRAEAIKRTLNPDGWVDSRLGKIFTANGTLKVPMAQARRAAGWIFDWLSDYNDSMENGVRLAAYKAGLERGLSKEQSASIAKNLTVNFNRKGQVSQQAGALYAFFNASVQGTARIAQTIFEMDPGKPKTLRLSPFGKKVVYGGIMLGSIQAMMLAAAGFNDEDPPEFAREKSLIIPVGGGKYLTIPMPLGFHVLPSIGRIATEFALSGFKDPHKRALDMFSMFADTFNPIGNAGLSMQTLAPTALDPLVALTENKDYTGKPIARESSNKAIPGHALGRDTATSLAKFLSEGINTISGGNKYVAGVFSPTPDQIDYLIGQVTGGVGRELSKVEQTGLAVARGEALPTFKIPLAGRFIGDAKQQASEGTAFYANTERLNKLETEIKGLQKDGKTAEAAELRRSSSESYLITVANQAERQIQRLRTEKREMIKAGAPREQIVAQEEKITAVMARLNRAVESLREKQPN